MKYFLSVNYLEDKLHQKILGINIPTFLSEKIQQLQLISIGIVGETPWMTQEAWTSRNKEKKVINESKNKAKEYYAICKDFDIKAAWNANQGTKEKPDYWLRENVLKHIWKELTNEYLTDNCPIEHAYTLIEANPHWFNLKELKSLINEYGKTRKQIAEEIKEFTLVNKCFPNITYEQAKRNPEMFDAPRPEFYAYYGATDWVVFCWLFGRMIDLPNGFTRYCKDLKQELDRKVSNLTFMKSTMGHKEPIEWLGKENMEIALNLIKGEGIKNGTYPKQTNEYNALDKAKWNKELHKFINTL